jgi:hypothetical protein
MIKKERQTQEKDAGERKDGREERKAKEIFLTAVSVSAVC